MKHPILFIHGFPFSGESFQKVTSKLTTTAIAPDLPGFGNNSKLLSSYSMEDLATYLVGILDERKVSQATILGHSMGGYVALAFLEKFPERVGGLVLVSTRAIPDSAEAAKTRRETAEKVRREGVAFYIDGNAPKMLALENANPDSIKEVKRLMGNPLPEAVARSLEGMAARKDRSRLLPSIKVPTLIISGDKDGLIPHTESEKMAKAIPESKLEIISGAGHLPFFEREEAFCRALTSFS